jgi:hypothetical protein
VVYKCVLDGGGMSVGGESTDDSEAESEATFDEPDAITSNTIVHDYASVVDAVRWVIRR